MMGKQQFNSIFHYPSLMPIFLQIPQFPTASQLAKHYNYSIGTVFDSLKLLINMGLIDKVTKGRKKLLELTPRGKAIFKLLQDCKRIFEE